MKKYLVLLALFLPAQAMAECTRFTVPEIKPGESPQFDGPGSFGPLHETLTLGCLKVTGVINLKDRIIALVKDEKGTVYKLYVGSYVGENHGRVEKITVNGVTIRQLINKNGKWVDRYVTLKMEK